MKVYTRSIKSQAHVNFVGDFAMLEFILFIAFIWWLLRGGFNRVNQYHDPIKWGCGFLMMVFGLLIILLLFL